MATVQFEFSVQGGGEVDLGVNILGDVPVVLTGLETVNLAFELTNPLDRLVTISLTVTKEGAAQDKATVSLLSDIMAIPAGATEPNQLIIEANQEMLEGDEFLVRVDGTEGAV
jgi:hypothetical protein